MLAVEPSTRTARRVLVVDDDQRIRRLVSRALGAQDIDVDEASDGEEGLRRAETTAYDVILLDLQMPGIGGMSVLHRLVSRQPGQAIVMFSCQGDAATVRECLRAGARDFVAKPFSLVDLAARVSAAGPAVVGDA
jgi:two-component system, NtrC family, nitrogen regulation response regulator NtrX